MSGLKQTEAETPIDNKTLQRLERVVESLELLIEQMEEKLKSHS